MKSHKTQVARIRHAPVLSRSVFRREGDAIIIIIIIIIIITCSKAVAAKRKALIAHHTHYAAGGLPTGTTDRDLGTNGGTEKEAAAAEFAKKRAAPPESFGPGEQLFLNWTNVYPFSGALWCWFSRKSKAFLLDYKSGCFFFLSSRQSHLLFD